MLARLYAMNLHCDLHRPGLVLFIFFGFQYNFRQRSFHVTWRSTDTTSKIGNSLDSFVLRNCAQSSCCGTALVFCLQNLVNALIVKKLWESPVF